MTYIDSFIAAVPTANKDKYRVHAEKAAVCFKKYGALSVVECWGEDVPDGETTSFPMAVKKAEDETVVAGWIVWPDKDTRNAGMAKVMDDPDMSMEANPMPFDGRRLIYGGFDLMFEA